MEANIYQTPKASLSMNKTKKGSPVKAVLIAAAVDIAGTTIAGIVLGVVYAAMLAANGVAPEEIAATLSNVSADSTLSLVGIALGLVVSLYAGYLCAKIVNHREYGIVTILGIISVSFGNLTGLLEDTPTYSMLQNILMSTLTFMCVYLGAWLHVRTKQKFTTAGAIVDKTGS
jgi:hypothetical protein